MIKLAVRLGWEISCRQGLQSIHPAWIFVSVLLSWLMARNFFLPHH